MFVANNVLELKTINSKEQVIFVINIFAIKYLVECATLIIRIIIIGRNECSSINSNPILNNNVFLCVSAHVLVNNNTIS